MLIETKRLTIRQLIHDDLELIYEINNDPDCIKFNGWEEMSLEDCQSTLYKWTFEYQTSTDYGVFIAVEKASNEPIGMCFLRQSNQDSYEIGFRFRKKMWGKGYAKEVTEILCDHAKHKLQAKRVFAETHTANTNSRNVFQKLNFEEQEHPSGPEGVLYERRF